MAHQVITVEKDERLLVYITVSKGFEIADMVEIQKAYDKMVLAQGLKDRVAFILNEGFDPIFIKVSS